MAEVHLEALLSSKAGVTTTITSGDSNRLVNQETGHQLGELLEHQVRHYQNLILVKAIIDVRNATIWHFLPPKPSNLHLLMPLTSPE